MAYKKENDKYRALWKRDNGPLVNKWDIDYSYYSPVDYGADSNKKYPLCIILVGALEGAQEGLEIRANEMPLWCDEKYQSRFNNGASFMMIPRAPEEDSIYWDQSCLVDSLKAAIDDFCQKHKNVDTERIYLLGWCVGSAGAINIASTYPEMFAATVLMCPDRATTKSEAERLSQMPFWIMCATTDSHSLYPFNTAPTWSRIRSRTTCKNNIRLTTCRRAVDVYLLGPLPAITNHNLWDCVSEDMHYVGPPYDGDKIITGSYKGMKTITGNGEKIEDPYLISWLNQFTNESKSIANLPERNARFNEKAYIFLHENIMHKSHLATFKLLSIIYRALGWSK